MELTTDAATIIADGLKLIAGAIVTAAWISAIMRALWNK